MRSRAAGLSSERATHASSLLLRVWRVHRTVRCHVFDGRSSDLRVESGAGRETRPRIPRLLRQPQREAPTSVQPTTMDGLQPDVDWDRVDAIFGGVAEEAGASVMA